jgi:signal transduction histidine kinase
VGESYEAEGVLSRMAGILRDAVGAERAIVWLRVGDELRPAALAPPGDAPAPEPVEHDELPELEAETAVEVRDRGELLGALAVSMPPNDPMSPSRERLIRDLASQAGLVLRNVRLIEELRESRLRIVTAQDERAKKLERNIHDGAQQQLVALAVRLRLAEQLAARDPGRVPSMLAELRDEANDALENLRDLARGIYPPLLADKGLTQALQAQARKSPIPVSVEPDGIGRYAQEAEAAVYFCVLEALQNATKYSTATVVKIALQEVDGHLVFEVRDNGVGFDAAATGHGSGLRGIDDRLAAVGGVLEITSRVGDGTSVGGRVPIARGRW